MREGERRVWDDQTIAGLGAVLLLCLTVCLAGCNTDKAQPAEVDRGDATRSQTRQTPAPDVASADAPITQPGVHKTSSGTALAFEPGMTRAETRELVSSAVAANQLVVTRTERNKRPLGDGEVEVLVEELSPRSEQVESLRLTHFGDLLVGVVVTWRDADRARVRALEKQYGAGTHNKGWVGWWDPQRRIIVQSSPDGITYEVFDLAVASAVIPNIETIMLESWRRRYEKPPPWGAELLEKSPTPSPGSPETP